MPRDGAGNYTLPPGNPVITGTAITSAWANPTLSDIGDEITNSLSRNGQGGMLVPLEFADGTVNNPGITFTNETTIGVYRSGSSIVGIGASGVAVGLFNGITKAITSAGQVKATTAAPVAANDLTRKDYVDAQILKAFPVGAMVIGWNPTGILTGTWVQLPEGTFLMNTVAGLSPAGGSNDAVVVAHQHATAGDHQHAGVGNHNHTYTRYNNKDTRAAGGSGETWWQNDSTINTSQGGAHQHAAAGDHQHAAAGVSGVNANRPLFKGVQIWERTA